MTLKHYRWDDGCFYLLWEQGHPAMFSAWWIDQRGNLHAASRKDVDSLPSDAFEKPDLFPWDYRTHYSSCVYRVQPEPTPA